MAEKGEGCSILKVHLNVLFAVSLCVLVFLCVPVDAIAFPPRQIKGSQAYIPFSLVMTFETARSLLAKPEPVGKSKPNVNLQGQQGLTFTTNEVDTCTLYVTLGYAAPVNQTIWVYVYAANVESDVQGYPVYATVVSFIFKIQTSIQPNIEQQLKQQENKIVGEVQTLRTEMKVFQASFQADQNNMILLIVLIGVVAGAGLAVQTGYLKIATTGA